MLAIALRTSNLLSRVNSAVMSARETIRLLPLKSTTEIYSTLFYFGALGERIIILDKLHELLQASAEELHRQSMFSPNALVDQRAKDLWIEMNRVTIVCDLAEVLRGGATESTEVTRLLHIGRDRNTTLAYCHPPRDLQC